MSDSPMWPLEGERHSPATSLESACHCPAGVLGQEGRREEAPSSGRLGWAKPVEGRQPGCSLDQKTGPCSWVCGLESAIPTLSHTTSHL